MPCVGVSFTAIIGDGRSPEKLVRALLREREVDFAKGDAVEVSLHVTRKEDIPKRRRLLSWLRQTHPAFRRMVWRRCEDCGLRVETKSHEAYSPCPMCNGAMKTERKR